MRAYSLCHLDDAALLRDLTALVKRDRAHTAALLAHIAEVDHLKLYAPAGCRSMRDYCVRELGLSEDSALKRVQAARKAREFPQIFAAIADGSLHLSGLCLLAPKLERDTVDELLASAAHRTKAEIESLLARRFPSTELMPLVLRVSASVMTTSGPQHAPGHAEAQNMSGSEAASEAPRDPATRLKPIAADRFALQFTIGGATHEKLRQAQALLSHAVPAGDLAEIFDRALDVLIAKHEKRKRGASSKPRASAKASADARHVPAHVRHAVWERDGARCMFVGENGRRCGSRAFLEFDHVVPVARGGEATVEGLRLRCRTHNQLEAERALGAGFMEEKRAAARRAPEQARLADPTIAISRRPSRNSSEDIAKADELPAANAAKEQAKDVLAGLRGLGVRAELALRAAEFSATLPVDTLEDRMKAALRYLRPKPSMVASTRVPA